MTSDPALSFLRADNDAPTPVVLLRSERCPPPSSRPLPPASTPAAPSLGAPATTPFPAVPTVDTRAATKPEPKPDLEVVVNVGGGTTDVDTSTLAPHPTRGKTLAPEVFSEGEVRALIGACSKRAITGVRNKALLAVLWRTGVRISEALDLLPCDVDFERGTVRVRLGKGLKSRTTVLNSLDCLPLLRDWLRLREQFGGAGEGAPLFCTLKGGRVETSYIRHLMPRLARRAGIGRRVHVHAMRHTHAADLAIAGVPVLAIQQQLGHVALSTTSDYLRRVGVRLDMLRMVRGATSISSLPPERPAAPVLRRDIDSAPYW